MCSPEQLGAVDNATALQATENDSAELSEEHPGLFGYDVASDVFYAFLDYTACTNGSDRVERSIAQL